MVTSSPRKSGLGAEMGIIATIGVGILSIGLVTSVAVQPHGLQQLTRGIAYPSPVKPTPSDTALPLDANGAAIESQEADEQQISDLVGSLPEDPAGSLSVKLASDYDTLNSLQEVMAQYQIATYQEGSFASDSATSDVQSGSITIDLSKSGTASVEDYPIQVQVTKYPSGWLISEIDATALNDLLEAQQPAIDDLDEATTMLKSWPKDPVGYLSDHGKSTPAATQLAAQLLTEGTKVVPDKQSWGVYRDDSGNIAAHMTATLKRAGYANVAVVLSLVKTADGWRVDDFQPGGFSN